MTEPEMVVGDEVILISKIKHFLYPDRYPEPGTIGKIERVYNHTIVLYGGRLEVLAAMFAVKSKRNLSSLFLKRLM